MQAQFESIFKELGAAASANAADPASSFPTPPPPAGGSSTTSAANADASFQDTIRRTMERMQTSGDQATAAAAAEGSDDFLAELLKQMGSGGGPGGLDGEGNEEEFSKMLMGMMDQLTNKEILYEPMRELNDKFPDWLVKNRDKTSAEDLKRYEEQQTMVKEIVGKFEESTYADSNAADREYIVDRMQKVSRAMPCPHPVIPPLAHHSCSKDASLRVTAGRPCRRHAVRPGRDEHAGRGVQSPIAPKTAKQDAAII